MLPIVAVQPGILRPPQFENEKRKKIHGICRNKQLLFIFISTFSFSLWLSVDLVSNACQLLVLCSAFLQLKLQTSLPVRFHITFSSDMLPQFQNFQFPCLYISRCCCKPGVSRNVGESIRFLSHQTREVDKMNECLFSALGRLSLSVLIAWEWRCTMSGCHSLVLYTLKSARLAK